MPVPIHQTPQDPISRESNNSLRLRKPLIFINLTKYHYKSTKTKNTY